MRYLLDTHTLLWFIDDDEQLSRRARQLIESSSNESLVSTASLWEIAIKMSLGKLDLGKSFEQLFPDELGGNNIEILNITVDHFTKVTTLPFHHRDPFDRLIIAQGMVDNLPIISIDRIFDAYEIIREW